MKHFVRLHHNEYYNTCILKGAEKGDGLSCTTTEHTLIIDIDVTYYLTMINNSKVNMLLAVCKPNENEMKT
jgi:hypothetical protein